MADRYRQLINTPIGRIVAKRTGLPNPPQLERYRPAQPVVSGPVLLGAAPGSRLSRALADVMVSIGAEVATPLDEPVRSAAAAADLAAAIWNPEAAGEERFKALVLDATGIGSSDQLVQAWSFLHPTIRRVMSSGRVIVLGTPPEDCAAPPESIAQRALEGLVRSIGKEVKRGATAQLVYVRPEASNQLESTLRFLLSRRSAFVSGQVIRVGAAQAEAQAQVIRVGAAQAEAQAQVIRVGAAQAEDQAEVRALDWERPLSGKVALVTGAARGIGAAIAEVLARDGAHVVGLDVPAMGNELAAVTGRLSGSMLTVDVTDRDAPGQIADHLLERHGGVDVVVHNAGVTRDKKLGRMGENLWRTVIDINLIAPQRIDRALFERDAVHRNGRIVCVTSISGIAGNAGQTNYATAKAGVIGIVGAWAPALAERGVTINAVAPGFIETRMTQAMPFALREAGRRMSSLSQGGLPVDVAETVAWYASPASGGVTANIVRVCGQSLIGA